MKVLYYCLWLICSCVSTLSYAQVKELKTLGKTWYLHGIDARVDLGFVNFYNGNTLQAIDGILKKELRESYNKPVPVYNYQLTLRPGIQTGAFHLGMVFRPFYGQDAAFLKNVELSHNVGWFDEMGFFAWDSISTANYRGVYGARVFNQSYYYNPTLSMSSITFFERLKLYAGVDLRFVRPVFSEYSLSKNSAKVVYAIDESTITEDNRYDTDVYNLQKVQNGIGYTLGVKGYLTCRWSWHAEFKEFFFKDKYVSTGNVYTTKGAQLLIGARYKFAKPEPAERKSADMKSVFW